MAKIKPFRYAKSKAPEIVPVVTIESETLPEAEGTGMIDGYQATVGEENLYKAAYKTGRVSSHEFRMAVGAPRGMPGWKELDFLFALKTGEFVAIQIRDYDFVHKGIESEASDLATDTYILQELAKSGVRVRGGAMITISDDDLVTPEQAKKQAEDLLI